MKHEGYGRTITQGENFYQYNGKELNQDFGLDMYDYGARFYDASVGRWFAIDPLAEKYVAFSPFNYVVNNPIMFIDPDGMYITGDEERVNELENYSTAQLSISDEELKKMGLDKKLIKKFRSVHQNTIDEIKELRNSDVEYHIGKLEANESGTVGGTGYNHKLNRVEVNVLGSDKATFAHEMKHAYQFEMGEIAFEVDVDRKSGEVNSQSDYADQSFVYDVYDEVDAYAREQTFYSYNGMAKQLGKTEEERKDWFMDNHYSHPGYSRLLRGRKERVGIYTKMKDMTWGPKGGGAKRVIDYMRMANQDPNFNGKRYFFNDKKSK
jgi:RHS repeat-associated protein